MSKSKQRLLEINAMLADNVSAKGVDASKDETTTSLVHKVEQIKTSKAEQEKEVTINKNGTTEILPDEDKTLSKVTVEVDVPDYLQYIASAFRFSKDISEITDDIYMDLSRSASLQQVFHGIPLKCKKISIKISNLCTTFHSTFCGVVSDDDLLEEIEIIGDTSNVTVYHNTFKTRLKLKRIIGELNFSNATNTGDMFMNDNNLVSVRATGTIYTPIAIPSRILDTDSAKSFLLCLADYLDTEKEYACKLAFASDVWDLLDAEGETAPGGVTWRLYASNKGWNT